MGISDDLKKSHVGILAAVENLTSEEMAREKTIGEWSVRDVILHIAMWEGEVLKALAVWKTGHGFDSSYVTDYNFILKFNDFWIENLKHFSPQQILQMFNLTHFALIIEVAAIPEEIWEKRGGVPKWLRDVTVDHNDEHISKLHAYKKSLEK